MARYGIATLLDECPVGYEFTALNIPLHLTHVDSFEVNLTAYELASKLRQALRGQKQFSVKAASDAFLGPNKDIPVTNLELTPELTNLHKKIMDMLAAENAILKNPQFHRDLYSPHVSIYGDRRIAGGQEVQIKNVSIGIKIGDDSNAVYRIVASIDLQ